MTAFYSPLPCCSSENTSKRADGLQTRCLLDCQTVFENQTSTPFRNQNWVKWVAVNNFCNFSKQKCTHFMWWCVNTQHLNFSFFTDHFLSLFELITKCNIMAGSEKRLSEIVRHYLSCRTPLNHLKHLSRSDWLKIKREVLLWKSMWHTESNLNTAKMVNCVRHAPPYSNLFWLAWCFPNLYKRSEMLTWAYQTETWK